MPNISVRKIENLIPVRTNLGAAFNEGRCVLPLRERVALVFSTAGFIASRRRKEVCHGGQELEADHFQRQKQQQSYRLLQQRQVVGEIQVRGQVAPLPLTRMRSTHMRWCPNCFSVSGRRCHVFPFLPVAHYALLPNNVPIALRNTVFLFHPAGRGPSSLTRSRRA